MTMYQALQITEQADGVFKKAVVNLDLASLPANELLVRVQYSSVNYKDMLSVTGNKGVTRHYPHTPGIDAVGIVERCHSDKFKVGDVVIVTGYDLGMNTPGGYGQYISVPESWALLLPQGLSAEMAMIYGTAGLTAALSVDKLLNNGLVSGSQVLVTGASGGVGTVAVAILAKLGMEVIAASGKPESHEMLKLVGASQFIGRESLAPNPKPMLRESWDAVCDTVGGDVLNSAIKQIRHGGSATTCGMVAGIEFKASVFPFIIRGVNLLGIDSVEIPLEKKAQMWAKIAGEWLVPELLTVVTCVEIEELSAVLDKVQRGESSGRYILKHH